MTKFDVYLKLEDSLYALSQSYINKCKENKKDPDYCAEQLKKCDTIMECINAMRVEFWEKIDNEEE